MIMKNVVVIYAGEDWDKKIPISNELTRSAFEEWHNLGMERNIGMYRASIHWYDKQKNLFKKAWAFRDGKWIKVKNIVPHLVYDKTASKQNLNLFDKKIELGKNVKLFNNPLFKTLADNKLTQYMMLSEFMPISLIALDKEDLKNSIKKIKTSKVVVKELHGAGGFGVKIGSKKEILEMNLDYPVMLQEFIKNNNGIPGFSQKGEVADLRIVFMNHKPVYALSRIAKKGSLFTNLHQGAKGVIVPQKAVPNSVWKVVEKIVNKLSVFSHVQYSLDFFFSEKNIPYLIEMNTMPGFDLIHVLGDEKSKLKNFESFISLIP